MSAPEGTPYTAEVFAELVLNRVAGPQVVAWAEAMLLAGFDSDHLIILVGEVPPYNQFELKELLQRTGRELEVPPISSDKEALEILVTCHIRRHAKGWTSRAQTLAAISRLANEEEFPPDALDFYFLDCAVEDLKSFGNFAPHWPEANPSNIDGIIQGKFDTWLTAHPLEKWRDREWV